MANIKIYIPTFVSDQNFNPARVNPRLFFYNGKVDCEPFLIESNQGGTISQTEIPAFPYFDHYSAESGSQFPGPNSKSLLFLNENTPYGTVPTASLYDEYWEKYVSLLYNPATRLLDASAIISLGDYNEMELNDIVQFRGNYYHLRAINEYDVKTGECKIQLLGPILADSLRITQKEIICDFTFTQETYNGTTTTSTTSTTSVPPVVPTTSTTSTSTLSPTTTTTTTTTAGVECYTYSIQNNDLSTSLTYGYTDCDEGLVGGQVVPPDSSTPDFCALSGSVYRQGGTTNWVLTEEAQTCTVGPTTTTTSTTTILPSTTTSTTTILPSTTTSTTTSTTLAPGGNRTINVVLKNNTTNPYDNPSSVVYIEYDFTSSQEGQIIDWPDFNTGTVTTSSIQFVDSGFQNFAGYGRISDISGTPVPLSYTHSFETDLSGVISAYSGSYSNGSLQGESLGLTPQDFNTLTFTFEVNPITP